MKKLTSCSVLAAALTMLWAASGGDCYDSQCYARCQAEACRDACSDERVREKPADCKACLESYDRVCVEQCRTRDCPRPAAD